MGPAIMHGFATFGMQCHSSFQSLPLPAWLAVHVATNSLRPQYLHFETPFLNSSFTTGCWAPISIRLVLAHHPDESARPFLICCCLLSPPNRPWSTAALPRCDLLQPPLVSCPWATPQHTWCTTHHSSTVSGTIPWTMGPRMRCMGLQVHN